jgi:hypothetical protein
MAKPLNWKPDTTLPVGKGATVQRYTTSDGINSLEIDTKPWGEGDLLINRHKRAHVENEASERRAFGDLEKLADNFESEEATRCANAELDRVALANKGVVRRKPPHR